MRRRLILLFLPSIYAPVSVANEALWNCVQNKDSKEWVCVGEKKSADKASVAKTPASTVPFGKAQENPVKDVPPIPVEAVDQSAGSGLARKAPEGARAGTASDKNIQPTVAKPEPVMPQLAPAENAEMEPSAPKLPASAKIDKDARQVSVESKPVAPSPADSDSGKVLQTDANRPGWTCDAKAADKNWNCKLAGADPKGQARVIESSDPGISLLTPAFDHNEEQTFSNLKSQLKYDPWQNCAAPKGNKPGFVPGKNLRDVTPLDINSDYAEIFDNEIYSYVGNVEMNRADQSSVSKKASYDNVSETLDLQGSVYYNDDELAMHGESASLNLVSDQAKLRDALFISPATPLRGRAKTIYRDSNTLSRYKGVAYTSCRPGNQDWVMHAADLKMNKTTGKGAAKNAWLEFKGTPVFYSPYLSFPIDNRRLSGFLTPSFGRTQRGGFSLSTPYYWNIAPNYDATFRPRYLSNRGAILGGNFRYLTEMTNGAANLEYMPHDSVLDKSRYLAAIKNASTFTPHINSNLDLNYVSDKNYFSDLGNALTTTIYSSFLLSQANLGYTNSGVSLSGHVDNYQSIDPSIKPAGLPYRKLPQVNLNLNHSFDFMPLTTAMDTEYVYFQHDSRVNAQRTNVKPSVSFPLKTASAFLTPKLSLQSTQYALSNPAVGELASDNRSRTLPIFSTDTGLYMEKDLNFFNRSYLHTLEPRLFYLYIPNTNQGNIPIFDTSLYDFSFNSMFWENRFSGTDRVGDANQLTTALTTRMVDANSGKDKLKLSVGQITYFQDRVVNLPGYQSSGSYTVTGTSVQNCNTGINGDTSCYRQALPGYNPNTDRLSNLVTELNVGLTDHVSVSTGTQWNPHLNEVLRFNSGLHYFNQPDINKPAEIINLGYRYRKNTQIPILQQRTAAEAVTGTALHDVTSRPYDIIQSDISVHWPIYNDWSAVGRWSYSLLNNNTQESFFGVEKENCCWAFRFIGRRWINSVALNQNPNIPNTPTIDTTATGIPQTGVFFEVEFKGLRGFGEKLDTFFEKQIYGYRKSEK